jgi:hypothetical protein
MGDVISITGQTIRYKTAGHNRPASASSTDKYWASSTFLMLSIDDCRAARKATA